MKGLVCVVAVLAALVVAAPSLAAFPGRNGLLAVAPWHGSGVALIQADGTHVRTVCPTGSTCQPVSDVSWSPDGRELLYAGKAIRILYTDGSCLDCAFGVAADPAFLPNGTEVSFIKDGHVVIDGSDSIRKSASVTNGSDAVWSSTGHLAVVRDGSVVAGAVGHLRRLGPGVEPSWSPDGREIAAVRDGSIVLLPTRGGRDRVLVPGGAPSYSPDGRFIAYVGAGHRLEIVSATASRPSPQTVGTVRAASVAWQPIPAHPASPVCTPPPGSKVQARASGAVVTEDTGDGASAWMGCLAPDGRERLLYLIPAVGPDSLVFDRAAFQALASPFAALLETDGGHYGSSTTVRVYDLRTGKTGPGLGGEETEGTYGGDVPILRDITLSSTGASAADLWSTVSEGGLSQPLDSLSCSPDGVVCLAFDEGSEDAYEATTPLAPAPDWKAIATPIASASGAQEQSVACPSASLCIAVAGSVIAVSQNGNPWTTGNLTGSPRLNTVTCASTTLCIATGDAGDIAVSSNPAAGAPSWQTGTLPGANQPFSNVATDIDAPVCAPDGTCSVNHSGQVLYSSDPAGGISSWQPNPSAPAYGAESCPSDSFCVALTTADQYAVASSPGATPQASDPAAAQLAGISCPTTEFCAAVGAGGTLQTSTDPANGNWTTTTIDLGRQLDAISCSSPTACVAADTLGHVVISSNPTGGASAWTPELIDGNPCADTTPCSVENIEANTGAGVKTVSTSTISGTGPYINNLTFGADILSWDQDGTPESQTISPSP